jgi:hypothetical protein
MGRGTFILSQHPLTNTDSPATISWKALSTSASLKQVAYRRNGAIYGFLVDGDSGERCYIDSEVVIARVYVPLLCQFKSNVAVTGWPDHTQELLGAPGQIQKIKTHRT